ncbi:MAG: saccharopine dehydrogenase NADP-binding domain-containing protein, partial [Myxococcota bacterium]
MDAQNKEFAITLWGATGFTGRIVANYLARRIQERDTPLSWSIAGRSRIKCEQLLDQLRSDYPQGAPKGIQIAQSQDPQSLDELCARSHVICTTVGPYSEHGTALVKACIEQGTHYCDLAGEVTWLHRMTKQFHPQAEQKCVRIVHCCGFDSIPSDIGCMMLQDAAIERFGHP